MNIQSYRLSRIVSHCFTHAVDFFGLWFWISLLKFFIFAIQMSGIVFIIGFSVRLFIGSVPENWVFSYPEGVDAYFTSIWIFFFSIGVFFLFEFFGGIIRMGTVQIAFDLNEEKETSFARILVHSRLAWHHMCAALLFDLCIIIGLFCFIIPGVILALRLWFYRQVMIDQQCGAFQALSVSAQITKKRISPLLLSYFTFFGLLQEPILHSAGLWGLVSFPVATLAHALFYRTILIK